MKTKFGILLVAAFSFLAAPAMIAASQTPGTTSSAARPENDPARDAILHDIKQERERFRARHDALVLQLRAAKTEDDRAEVTKELKANIEAHRKALAQLRETLKAHLDKRDASGK